MIHLLSLRVSLITIFAVVSSFCSFAATATLGIGESYSTEIDATGYHYISIESVTSTNPSVKAEKIGLVVKATVMAAFSGESTITANIRYKLYPQQNYQYRKKVFTIAYRNTGGGTGGNTGGSTQPDFTVNKTEITVDQGCVSEELFVNWFLTLEGDPYTWSVIDNHIASIDHETGRSCKVYGGENAGTTYVTVTNSKGYFVSIKINVSPKTYNPGDTFIALSEDATTKYPLKFRVKDNNRCALTGESSVSTLLHDITIPNYALGYSVDEISDYAFAFEKKIKSIKGGKSIKIIGKEAFNGCSVQDVNDIFKLKGDIQLGERAFKNCKNLTELKLIADEIPSEVCYDCTSLKKLIISAPVRSIASDAFHKCNSLKEVYLPRTYRTFDKDIFSDCDITDMYVTYEYPISPEPHSLGIKCDEVNLHIPEGLSDRYISDPNWSCFKNIIEENMLDIIQLSDRLGKGKYTNSLIDQTTYVTKNNYDGEIDLSIMRKSFLPTYGIEDFALSSNTCTKITLPSELRYIGNYSFANSIYLRSIEIKDHVFLIANSAFNACDELTDIYVTENNPYYCSKDGILYTKRFNTLERVPSGREGELTLRTASVIKTSAFGACYKLTNIVIPSDCVQICDGAFYCCDSLKTLTLPSSIKLIEDDAFLYMSLESLHVQWEKPLICTENAFDSDIYNNTTLFVPVGTKELYSQTVPWKLFKTIKEENQSGIDHTIANNDKEICSLYTVSGVMLFENTYLHEIKKNLTPGYYILKYKHGETEKIYIP